jgi:caa3-type cytochrome oxidase assembly factor Caa3/CtaG
VARRPWYLSHYDTTRAWGLTPLEDQQLAGLIMWVPAGFAYLGALVAYVAVAIGERPERRVVSPPGGGASPGRDTSPGPTTLPARWSPRAPAP